MKKLLFCLVISLNVYNAISQQVKLLFVETTDLHGCIFPYDLIRQEETKNSLAQIATYVNREREKTDQKVILLDNGDFLQGQPVAYYYNFEDTTSAHIFSKVFNYMKYDVATIGNHDIETGHDVYDKIVDEFNFSWLAANAVDTKTGKPYWKPYEIIEYENIKIAILGLTTPGIPKWLPENLWEGIEFQDMIIAAEKWIDHIKITEDTDLIVGLFHSGIDFTYGGSNAETPRNENASLLIAEQVPGFDIVFAGHDHRKYNAIVENVAGDSVLVLNGTSHARYAAVAEVIINKQADNSTEKKLIGQLVDISAFEPDKQFIQKFSNEFDEVKSYVNQPIAVITASIDSKDAYFGSSAFIDLIHNAQLELTDADISFSAPLSYNTIIDSGKVLVSDMFKLYKFENMLYTIKMTGKEIDDYLEFSYAKWLNTMSDSSDFLFKYRFDQDQVPERLYYSYYDFDSALGILYTVDVSRPDGDKVSILSLQNGNDFYNDTVYKVAINSYRGNGGGGHLTDGAGFSEKDLSERLIYSTNKDLRFLMMQWLRQKQNISPESQNNWKIIPESWIEHRRPIEEQILFSR